MCCWITRSSVLTLTDYLLLCHYRLRDHSGYGLSQWETTLHCKVISHWICPYPEKFMQILAGLSALQVFYVGNTAAIPGILITSWGMKKMAAMLQMTFSNADAFSWKKSFTLYIGMSLKFIPKGPIDNMTALLMARQQTGITWPQWVIDSLGPTHTVWYHRSWIYIYIYIYKIASSKRKLGCASAMHLF